VHTACGILRCLSYPTDKQQIHSQFAQRTMSVKLMSLVMHSVQNKKRLENSTPMAPRTGLEPVTTWNIAWRADIGIHSTMRHSLYNAFRERQIHSQFAQRTMSVKLMSRKLKQKKKPRHKTRLVFRGQNDKSHFIAECSRARISITSL
jgi:hypothetical protein